MKPDAIIIRHSECGLPESLTGYVDCPIINAGDGKHTSAHKLYWFIYNLWTFWWTNWGKK